MSQFHVSQIETHLRTLYESTHWVEAFDDVANMSRLLALHAVHVALGPEDGNERVVEITDGEGDRGIDAVGVDTNAKIVVLVQSKWRQDGTGSMALQDVLKFLAGVKSLLGMRADDEPVHASPETKTAVRDVLKTPGGRIRLVTVTTASDPLSAEVETPILELLSQLNDLDGIEPLAKHSHLDQAELFNSIAGHTVAAVDLELQMLDWGKAAEPQTIYYGRVVAAEIAQWYSDHGPELFAENIRVVIPRSDINQGILQTIQQEPESFAYYNNGITVLAREIEMGAAGAITREAGFFKLGGASIVNGAQTVSTLGSALGTDYEDNLGKAFVLVRCIEVPETADELGQRITRFANTQNEVSSQDFAFLDKEQHRLVRELTVLGIEYILRSAEVPKTKDLDKVVDVRTAAIALACASPSISHAVTAKREVSRLFSDDSVYKTLFNPQTDPLRLSRAVAIMRRVDGLLDEVERTADGGEAGIAVHGRRVISHIVMRRLGDSFLSSPESDLDAATSNLEGEVAEYVARLANEFPNNAYPGNVFKNQTRVVSLLDDAGIEPYSAHGVTEVAQLSLGD